MPLLKSSMWLYKGISTSLSSQVVGRSMPYYEFIPSHPFRAVNEPGVCRGSCTTHKERRAITRELMELSEEDKSLDKIEERLDQ